MLLLFNISYSLFLSSLILTWIFVFQPLVVRHDELRERARQLLQARTQKNPGSSATSPIEVIKIIFSTDRSWNTTWLIFFQNDEDRQQQLRERARRLIAEARKGVTVNSSQIGDDNKSERHSLDEQNNSPRRSLTPSTTGDNISVKVLHLPSNSYIWIT